VPENPSARFLVTMALAGKMDGNTFGAALKYLKRLPAMFRAFAIRDSLRAESNRRRDGTLPKGWAPIANGRDFTAWTCTEDGKNIVSASGQ